VTKNLPIVIARYLAALAAVLLITYFYYHEHRFNATTVAFTFLLAILGVSAVWGLAVSVFMSLAATLAYNYFFLPPVGTFTIADPQNWVALFTFLVTSVLASELATRARNQAAEANRRRREVERLYGFSQRLLSAGNPIEGIPSNCSMPFRDRLWRRLKWGLPRCSSWTSRRFTVRE
jgi:two-component system sensor histidine kinase KdpD